MTHPEGTTTVDSSGEKCSVIGVGLAGLGPGGSSTITDVRDDRILRIRPLHYDWKYDKDEVNRWKMEARRKDRRRPRDLPGARPSRVPPERSGDALGAGREDRNGLSGAHDVAQPGAHHRPSDYRRLAAEEPMLGPPLNDLGDCHQVECHRLGSEGVKE